LILYNNLVNLLPQQLHDRWYVLVNLGFLAVLVLWAIVYHGIDRTVLGLRWPKAGWSALWGLGVGLVVISPLFVLLAFPSFYSDKINDPRLSGLNASDLVYRAAVRIPLGTALFEEMAFRGLLFAALMRFGIAQAIWASSLVFALWHIMPTWELIQASTLADLSVPLKGMALIGGLLATFVGGLLFALLRRRTGSVTGPIVAHATINSLALVAVFLGQAGSS